jgi:hypothetical protein
MTKRAAAVTSWLRVETGFRRGRKSSVMATSFVAAGGPDIGLRDGLRVIPG